MENTSDFQGSDDRSYNDDESEDNDFDDYEDEDEDWENLSLSEFWSEYDIVYEGKRNEYNPANLRPLQNEKGWIKRRNFDAVLRYYLNYENIEDFCRGLLILFFPFRDEMKDIHEKDVKALVVENWEEIQHRRDKFLRCRLNLLPQCSSLYR